MIVFICVSVVNAQFFLDDQSPITREELATTDRLFLPLNELKYQSKYSTSSAETLLIRNIEQNDLIIQKLDILIKQTK